MEEKGKKETNEESDTRHRIFGDGLRSMGLVRVGYPMHPAGGTLHQSGLGRLWRDLPTWAWFCPFSCAVVIELIRQHCNFWPVLLCFGIFEPAIDRMWNGLLPCHAPPPMRPSCPADRARLLFLRTCTLKVSHVLCRKAKLSLRRTP